MICDGREDMAKKVKNKMHVYFRYTIISLVIGVVLFTTIFMLTFGGVLGSSGEQVVFSNEYYMLRGRPTDLQKELFKELTEQVEKKIEYDMDLVELVAKNFVADYYTWSNKQGPFDIGGAEFVFGKENLNFKQNARRYFYSGMEAYISQGLEINELIEVESLSSNDAAFSTPFNHYGEEYVAYYVEVSWVYKANEKIDVSKFPTFASFTLVQNADGRFEIVRFY